MHRKPVIAGSQCTVAALEVFSFITDITMQSRLEIGDRQETFEGLERMSGHDS